MRKRTMIVSLADILALMEEIGISREIVDTLDAGASIFSQGIDSMDFPALAVAAERKYGVDISDSSAARLKTVNDLVRFINARICH